MKIIPERYYDFTPFERLNSHGDHILIAAVLWQILFLLSGYVSTLFPVYQRMSKSKRINWRMHIVSFVHAVIICVAVWPILFNKNLSSNPILGWDSYAESAYSVSAGYFIWDLYVSVIYFALIGPQFLYHAICCLSISICLYRPVYQYYGAIFLIFEFSTIFLNIHWFMDKFGLTGSVYQMINGVFLLGAFFFVRICYGTYQAYNLIADSLSVWDSIPGHYFWLYAVVTLTLQPLNFYWFYGMIRSLMSRFRAIPIKKEQ